MAKSIREGLELAEKCLASNDVGIVEQSDRLFGLWGLIELGEYKKVQSQLEKVSVKSLDSAESLALYLVTLEIFMAKSGRSQFARDKYSDLKKMVVKLKNFDENNDGLLETPVNRFSLFKPSPAQFSDKNILYASALFGFAKIAKKIKKEKDSQLAEDLSVEFKEQIRNNFWTGDYICESKDSDKFSLLANVLAVVFGLTHPAQNRSIYEYMSAKKMFNNLGSTVADLLLPLMLWRLGHKLQAKECLTKVASRVEYCSDLTATCQLNCSLFIYTARLMGYSI